MMWIHGVLGILFSTATFAGQPSPSPTIFKVDLPGLEALKTSIEVSDLDIDNGLKPKVIILLDSSGSMAQPLDKKKSKMFYAKKLFGEYLRYQWREKAQVGLVIYGGRRKRDCSDTYLAIKPGEKSLNKIDVTVKKLGPTGMTPIARSLQIAVDQLKGYPGPKRIMIFTDGEETCGGDSCKILERAIQDKVIDLEMFVTGIGMSEKSKDLDSLRCEGAKMFGAQSSGQLSQALNDINNMIDKSSKNQGGNNLYVECPNPLAEVKLYKLENGKREYLRSFPASYGVKVPPGVYSAEVMLKPIFTFPSFNIPPKKKVTLKVAGSGLVEVKFFNGLLDVEVLNKDKKVIQSFLSDNPTPVKTGIYDIHLVGEPFWERTEPLYKVIPGAKHDIEVEGIGAVQIDYPSVVGLHVFDGSEKDLGQYVTNFPFVLKAGTYKFYVNPECIIEGINVRSEKSLQRLKCLPNKDKEKK